MNSSSLEWQWRLQRWYGQSAASLIGIRRTGLREWESPKVEILAASDSDGSYRNKWAPPRPYGTLWCDPWAEGIKKRRPWGTIGVIGQLCGHGINGPNLNGPDAEQIGWWPDMESNPNYQTIWVKVLQEIMGYWSIGRVTLHRNLQSHLGCWIFSKVHDHSQAGKLLTSQIWILSAAIHSPSTRTADSSLLRV